MKRFPTRVLAACALAAVLVVAPPTARGSAEDAAEERAPAAAPNVVQEGILHNTVHGFRFPVPQGFELRASSTGDEIVLVVPDCDECILRVLVSPGNTDSLETTARALKKQVASEPNAQILDEQKTKVVREAAYTLVKEETVEPEAPKGSAAPAGRPKRVLTRYVTFNRGEDKFYFVLREPSDRFGEGEDAFERLLAKLQFDS